MLGIFKKLAAFSAFEMPPLEVYATGPRPRKKDVEVVKAKAETGRVNDGKEWRDYTDKETGASVSELVTEARPKSAVGVVIDEYDTAYLTDHFGASFDVARARMMKYHWQKGDSADAIERSHRTKGGKLEKGYGARTAADFIKVFYLADDRRAADGKARIREGSATPPPSNTVEW